MVDKPITYLRLARGKFELTIQESTGEKNSQENQASFLTGEDIKYGLPAFGMATCSKFVEYRQVG